MADLPRSRRSGRRSTYSPEARALVCLTVTCHDPSGSFEPGVRSAAATLRTTFAAVVVNATNETAPATMAALDAELQPTTDLVVIGRSSGPWRQNPADSR